MHSHLLDSFQSPESSPGRAFALAISLLISFVTLGVIYNLFFHPLRLYPGPKINAASVLPFVYGQASGTMMFKMLDMHNKYGPVVRVAPNELSFSHPDAFRDILAHRQGHEEFSKSRFSIVKPVNGAYGILTAAREDHSRYRRLLSHSFSEKGMREQQSNIITYIDLLVNGLRDVSNQGPQDMVKWFNWTSFDIIGALSFGKSFECLKTRTTHPWVDSLFSAAKASVLLGNARRLGLQWMLPYLVSKKTIRHRVSVNEYAKEKMERRLKMGADNGDFWDNLLRRNDTKNELTLEEMQTNAFHLVLAGSETTATLLSGCIYLCLRHPKVMESLVHEIRKAFKNSDDINLFSVSDLKYTMAVLDETMRLYPPVPMQASREVPAGGDFVLGQFLPGETVLHTTQWVYSHLEDNFRHPTRFHPERFLGDPEFADDNKAAFQPFSIGSRNCIGRNLAYAEMRLILAKLLYNFDLELDPQTGDWTNQKAFGLWEKVPLWVKLKPLHTKL